MRTSAGAPIAVVAVTALAALAACGPRVAQLTPDQVAFQKKVEQNALLAKTVNRPGSTAPYPKGAHGGTWQSDLNDDPKSFNMLHSQDTETDAVVGVLADYLLDYDAYKRQWKPNVASYEVKVNDQAQTMDVTFTLRDDLYWTTLADPSKKVKVTSDDVVYWYNDIVGDQALQQSGYSGQFLQMPDGGKKHIDMEKIDDRRFVMHYPRIVAMPELSSNMNFGPRYIFEPVKKAKGVEGLLNLWSIDTDPKTIPSMGQYYIQSYRPGVGVTLVRNPNYWKKDDYGQQLPYIDTIEMKIVPNRDTEKLKFLANELDSYSLRPEDLSDMVAKDPRNYSVYYAGPSLGAAFISWNQNPKNLAPKYLKWFSNTTFRQAMSCFLNRDRIVTEVYRGLADPDLSFFAKPNPFYDPAIAEQYTYNPARGKELLAEIGIKPNANGLMQDSEGNVVTYDLEVTVENNVAVDIANIFADELKKVGITLNVKPLQFQKIVQTLMQTYDWQCVMISVGSNYFPIQGDNVWLSSGNLHLWNPLEAKPATAWESQIDDLYWKGYSTRDNAEAKKIWDQYQRIILDQLPVMYLTYPDVFSAYRDRWANLRVDALSAPDMNYVYLKP
ncbi:MAG TPA: ABC transporter substrate-binding protein [Spirochaetia bacterium]|nr:ABC transporter substrate-binding protein [Spirochaetia bacterium]